MSVSTTRRRSRRASVSVRRRGSRARSTKSPLKSVLPARPRPPGARRLLSAAEVGKPYGVALYVDSSETPESLADFYRRDLPSRSWRVIEPNRPFARSAEDPYSVFAERNGVLGIVILGRDAKGTTVTMLTGSVAALERVSTREIF